MHVVSDSKAGEGWLSQEQMLRGWSFSRLSHSITWVCVQLALVELVIDHNLGGQLLNFLFREAV